MEWGVSSKEGTLRLNFPFFFHLLEGMYGQKSGTKVDGLLNSRWRWQVVGMRENR